MASTDFENLEIYRLAEEIADEIWAIVLSWPAFAKSTVGNQIVRSADSVGANIAEGCGRGSHADNKRFVRTARGSLNETRHWLRRAYQRKLLTAEQVNRLKPMLRESAPRLNADLNSIGRFPGEHPGDEKQRTWNQERNSPGR
jgi:four helix bundle protein